MEEVLDCGKAVNFTYYDDLIGVAQRYNHPVVPEPEVCESSDLLSFVVSKLFNHRNLSIFTGCLSVSEE